MSRTRSFVFVLALGVAGCSRSEPVPAKHGPAVAPAQDPQAARALIARGAVIVDVRTADEYAGDHLADAVNLPVQDLDQRMADVERLVAGDKTRPIVVYCASGGRAAKAKQVLEAAGYSQVTNGGGLDDLR